MMTYQFQVGDILHCPYPDNPNRWWHGTAVHIHGGDVVIHGAADLTPPDPRKVVKTIPGFVVTREVPKCFNPNLAGGIPTATPPPDRPHLSNHQSRRERRRNRKRGQ